MILEFLIIQLINKSKGNKILLPELKFKYLKCVKTTVLLERDF